MADLWSDSKIDSISEDGVSMKNKDTSGKPRFGYADLAGSPERRDQLRAAFMGFNQGMQAAQGAIQMGSPIAASLQSFAGAAGGVSGQDVMNQRLAQESQTLESQLGMLSVDQISPGLVEKHPELSGMPLGIVHKIAPILQRDQAMEKALIMAGIREQVKFLNPQERTLFAKMIGISESEAEGIRTSVAGSLAQAGKIEPVRAEAIAGAASGIRAATAMEKLLTSKNGPISRWKAGGFASGILTIGDSDAQRLRAYANELADVITRQRTGAALNKEEQIFYGSLILDRWNTPEVAIENVRRYRRLLEENEKLLKQGKFTQQSKESFLSLWEKSPDTPFVQPKLIKEKNVDNSMGSVSIKMVTPDGREWDVANNREAISEALNRGAQYAGD